MALFCDLNDDMEVDPRKGGENNFPRFPITVGVFVMLFIVFNAGGRGKGERVQKCVGPGARQ